MLVSRRMPLIHVVPPRAPSIFIPECVIPTTKQSLWKLLYTQKSKYVLLNIHTKHHTTCTPAFSHTVLNNVQGFLSTIKDAFLNA